MAAEMTYLNITHSGTLKLIDYLELEESLARDGSLMQDVFFMWQVSPTVIYGRNQVREVEVNEDYCRDKGIEVVQRKSGGGCVYADMGNIMLSAITKGDDVQQAFRTFLQSLSDALKSLGLNAEVSGRNDVIVDGKKVSGNACYAVNGRCIVHGTLLFDVDMDALEKSITPTQEKLASKGIKSVRQRVTNLRPLIEASEAASEKGVTDMASLRDYLKSWFSAKEMKYNL